MSKVSVASSVALWLTDLGHEAQAVRLTIGNQTWEGAVYTNLKLDQDPRYYLVGKLPKSYGRDKACYTLEGDEADWYVICYMQDAKHLAERFRQYHPFGNSFSLGRWTSDGKIDEYESGTRRRLPISIEVVE